MTSIFAFPNFAIPSAKKAIMGLILSIASSNATPNCEIALACGSIIALIFPNLVSA